jgi:hypothetical protein
LEVEAADEHLGSVRPNREEDLGILIEESKARREYADDLPRPGIDDHLTPDDPRIATELPLPVGVTQHRPLRGCGRVVFPGEAAAHERLDPKHAERPVGDEQGLNALRFSGARDRHGRVVPEADVLEDAALLAIHEVGGCRLVREREPQAGRGVPDANQPFRLAEWKRLQQDTVHDAEDGGVRADA